MTICQCGRAMNGNGARAARVTDWQHGRFVTSSAEIRRLRCRDCGATISIVSPEMEEGFRISKAAADMIVERALNPRNIDEAPVDAATVSRLLAARKATLLTKIERPRLSRLELVPSVGLMVSDAITHEVSTVFSSFEDKALIPWLSSPHPSVLSPDVQVAPKLLKHAGDFVIALPVRVLTESLWPLLERAEQRLKSLTTKAASPSTTHSRHFERLRSQLFEALDCSAAVGGKKALGNWFDACQGAWADIFSPVLRFLQAFSATIFSHPACIVPPPPRDRLHLSGPANLLALRIERDRVLRPTPSDGGRLGLAFR